MPKCNPNILLILVDDLTLSLGCYGNALVRTPHLDRLASRGVLFANTICQSPLCTPSRASMLTGLRPDHTGIHLLHDRLSERCPHAVTLPALFRRAGYFTARAGKVFHLGVPDSIVMHSSGDDDPQAWDVAINCPGYELNSNGVFHNATPWQRVRAGSGGAVSWLRAENPDHHQHDHIVATRIIKQMEEHAHDPFFLAAGFVRPHVPLVAPGRFFAMYDDIDVPLPPTRHQNLTDRPYANFFGTGFCISDEDHRQAIRAYYACVSFLDEQVGRLMAALDRLNLADRTVVLFTADHGYQLGEHGVWFKKFLFEGSIRVPLIIASPEHRSTCGQVTKGMTELVDLYPTLLELAGLDAPGPLDGVSRVPALRNPDAHVGGTAFSQTRQSHGNQQVRGRCLRTERWKYNRWTGTCAEEELFDLMADPFEAVNLASCAAYQDVLDRLRTQASAASYP